MKKIDVSQIVDPSIQQPFTGLSLAFLQEASKEMTYALCRNIIKSKGYTFSPTIPYKISADNYGGITGDGFIFYGNELYRSTEDTIGLDYALIDTTPDVVADPVLFTDSVNRNVHNNRYLTYSMSPIGALFAMANVIDVTGITYKVADEYVLLTQFTTSLTYSNLTGLTYTTTKAAKYEIELKGTIYINSTSGASAAGGGALFRLFNTTDLASLDDSRVTINTIATGPVDSVIVVNFQCKTISFLASGKTIDSQFAMEIGTDDITALDCKMFVKEL
jgi:hypothetical protein